MVIAMATIKVTIMVIVMVMVLCFESIVSVLFLITSPAAAYKSNYDYDRYRIHDGVMESDDKR